MDSLRLMLQNPVFLICLLVGAFVVLMFCFDQFDKPIMDQEDNDPWKFVAPRNLTPRWQYLVGFSQPLAKASGSSSRPFRQLPEMWCLDSAESSRTAAFKRRRRSR